MDIKPRTEVPIGANTYSVGEMNVFDQMDVYRRIVPLLTGFISAMVNAHQLAIGKMIASVDDPAKVQTAIADIDDKEAFFAGLNELMLALARMPKDDFDYIRLTTLAAARRRQTDGSWAAVTNTAGHLMFHDMTAGEVMYLMTAVLKAQAGIIDFVKKFLAGGGQDPQPQAVAEAAGK